jgi:hypothetical protein
MGEMLGSQDIHPSRIYSQSTESLPQPVDEQGEGIMGRAVAAALSTEC